MSDIRELKAARAATADALRGKVTEFRSNIGDAERADAVDAEVRALEAELAELDARIAREERAADLERATAGRPITGGDRAADTAAEWRSLARGEHRAMTAGGATDGAAMVPEQLARQIINRLVDISPVRRAAMVMNVSSGDFSIPVNVRGMASGWAGEATDRSAATDTPTVREVRPTFGEIYALPQVSNHLLDDSAYDVGRFIVENAATEFASAEGAAFISGDGTNKPTGFLTGVTPETAGDATRTAGALQYIETAAASVIGADDVIDLVYTLRAPYRPGAAFMMSSTVAQSLRKLKGSDGQFIWAQSLAAGQPDQLLGYPVVIAEDMPALADGNHAVAFGNFMQGYAICDRTGLRLIRDEVTNPGHTKFYLSRRVGGIVTDDAAIKLLRVQAV